MSKAKRVKFKTGIEIWDGLPGSGKSYGVTKMLADSVVRERRVVYTNLPIKWRVFRKFVEVKTGDVRLGQYIRPLNQAHFRRFIERNKELTDYVEEVMASEGIRRRHAEARFIQKNGPHICEGRDANWFYTGSVIVGDEIHRWFDQRKQMDESPALLTYLTMHRHHLHRLVVMSQDRMQISLPWRRNAVRYVHCADKRNLPFVWSVKLPLLAMCYEEWPKEVLEGPASQFAKPSDVWVEIPRISNFVYFRLYDSYTHMGNAREMRRAVDSMRNQIEGPLAMKTDEQAKQELQPPKRRRGGWFRRLMILVLLVLAVTFWMQRDKKHAEQLEQLRASHHQEIEELKALTIFKQEGVTPVVNKSPEVSAMGVDYVVIEGSVIKIGDSYDGFTLQAVAADAGRVLWAYGDQHISGGFERVSSKRNGQTDPNSGSTTKRFGELSDKLRRAGFKRGIHPSGPDAANSASHVNRPVDGG